MLARVLKDSLESSYPLSVNGRVFMLSLIFLVPIFILRELSAFALAYFGDAMSSFLHEIELLSISGCSL